MLDLLRRGGTKEDAAAIVGAKLMTLLGWIDRDPVFAEEVRQAEKIGGDVIVHRDAKPEKAADGSADRWRRLREDAAKLGAGMFGYLLAVEARVVAVPGNVGMSPFWRYAIEGFYDSGAHELCAIAGRGAGKSTVQILIATTELMFRDRHIPKNDPQWIWPFMSHNMAESNQRVMPFQATLSAIGVHASDRTEYLRKDGRSEIHFSDAKGQPVKVNIYPNTPDATRGGNLAGATDDEELFWQADKDKGLSRADDVLAVLVNSFRADRSRVHIRISSVNDEGGAMLEAAEQGSTELRFVPTLGPFLGAALDGFARVAAHLEAMGLPDGAARVRGWAAMLSAKSPWIPSWVGNPTHDPVEGFKLLWSKLRVHQDRVGIWLRENGSCTLPVGASGALWEHETIERARTAPLAPGRGERFAAIDTGAKKNPAALAIVERVRHDGRWQWRPVLLRQWRRKRGAPPLDLRLVVLPEMARLVLQHGCLPSWWSDGWAGDAVELVGAEHGIKTVYVSTSTAYRDVYEPIDDALRDARGPSIVLAGCAEIEAAVAQLGHVRRGPGQSVIVPAAGSDHGELGQVLCRALAHAGAGRLVDAAPTAGFRAFDGRYADVRRHISGRR